MLSAPLFAVILAAACVPSVAKDASRFLQTRSGNRTTVVVQSKAGASKTVLEAFGQGSSDPQNADGVLLHMISTDIVQMVQDKALSLRDLIRVDGDCGPTCSAWAYLRADMAPLAYLNDHWDGGAADKMVRMSLIIDTSVVQKKLVTGMGITDSDTWHRSACRSMGATFDYPGESTMPECYIPPDGACAGKDCTIELPATEIADKNAVDCHGDEVCEAVHSGNGIHLTDFPWWPQCTDTHEWDTCISTTAPCPAGGTCEIAFNTDPGSCQACSLPYFCDPNATPGEVKIDDGSAIRIGVGSDVSGFASQFFPESNPKQIESKQCKWSPRDWSIWVERMKGMRNVIYNSFEANHVKWHSDDFSGPFLENEVNLYVPPEGSASYPSANAQWQDSLMGIGVDLQFCTERFPDSQQLFGITAQEECNKLFGEDCNMNTGCTKECDAIHAVFVKGCALSEQTNLPLYSTKLLTTLRPTELWKGATGDVFEDITSKCKSQDSYYTCK